MSHAKYEAVLFDLDGTLIDTYQLILGSMQYATQKVLGVTLSDAKLMARVGTPLEDQMVILADGDHELGAKLTDVYREHNHRVHDERIHRFEGISEALQKLQAAKIPLAVVTSKKHALAMRGIKCCGLEDLIDFVIGPDDFPAHKPDPGPVLEGCKRLNISSNHCLYIGDSPYDIQAGNAAGCDTAAVLWGVFSEDELASNHPTFTLATPSEMASLILEA